MSNFSRAVPRVAAAKSAFEVAAAASSATAVNIPTLADFRLNNRSRLVATTIVRSLARTADFLTATVLGLLIAVAYVNGPALLPSSLAFAAIALTGLFTIAALEVLGLYAIPALTSVFRQMPRIALGWTVACAASMVIFFFLMTDADLSRAWLAIWFVTGAAALIGNRILLSSLVRSWMHSGRLYRRAVIYGANDVAAEVIAGIERDGECDIRISGIFDDRDDERSPRVVAGYPRLGGIDDLLAFARESRVDLIILALPLAAEARLSRVLRAISVLPVDIKLPADASAVRFGRKLYSHIGRVPMIDLCDKPIADWGNVMKWLFDKTIAGLALFLLSPLMLVIAALIKLDSRGPALFRQKRYGFNNELIEVLKFRSMYIDRCDANASKLATKDDPRITPIGRFLRKSSLDELPQLINVLFGDLSLVGPRPHALQAKAGSELYDAVVEGYFARHKVKPGITGWAQINGWRGETDTAEKIQKRVEHDLYYIENWSVFFDIYILLRTPFALLNTKNAY